MSLNFNFISREKCLCGAQFTSGSARTVEKVFRRGTIRFVECEACDSWIQSPRIDTASLVSWYDSDSYQRAGTTGEGVYLDYASSERERRIEAGERVRRDIKPFLPVGARVLEIGSATGTTLRALNEAGYASTGIDISPEFVHQAKTLNNVDVLLADFLDAPLEDNALDCILMLGTFPNMQDPLAWLQKIHRILRPDGLFIFNAPIRDSLPGLLLGKSHWMFAPSVMQYPTREGCRRGLQSVGFDSIAFATDRQSPTVSKLLGHLKARWAYPLVRRLGLANRTLPRRFPIPGVTLCHARKAT